jgi:hypothetical protein
MKSLESRSFYILETEQMILPRGGRRNITTTTTTTTSTQGPNNMSVVLQASSSAPGYDDGDNDIVHHAWEDIDDISSSSGERQPIWSRGNSSSIVF